jgi:hypothetical protein
MRLQPPAAPTAAEANFAARGVIKLLMKLLTTRGEHAEDKTENPHILRRDVHLWDSARSPSAGRPGLCATFEPVAIGTLR